MVNVVLVVVVAGTMLKCPLGNDSFVHYLLDGVAAYFKDILLYVCLFHERHENFAVIL